MEGICAQGGSRGLGLRVKGRTQQNHSHSGAWPGSQIWGELDPIANPRLDPGSLGESAADQFEVFALGSNQNHDHATRRFDSDEINDAIGTEQALGDQVD